MKILFASILLIFSIQTHAGIGWLLVGAALSDGNKNPPQPSDLQIQISTIQKTLPKPCYSLGKYSGCWGQFSKEEMKFSVSEDKKNELKSYFINNGYKVQLQNDELIFDFSEEYPKYLYWKNLPITMETAVLLFFLSLPVLFFIKLKWNWNKRVIEIKKAYENSKNELVFWNKDEKKELEEALANNTVPSCWRFSIENNKIQGISFYNGRSVGRIASRSGDLYNSLKPFLKYEERLKRVKEEISKEKENTNKI